MTMPLLDLRELTRDYVSRGLFSPAHTNRALDAVDLSIAPGEIFGLVGESGSGKSTLARIAAALDTPTSGQVLFEGDDLFALSASTLKRRRRDFQMVFQDPYGSLDPRMTVDAIVAEPLHVLARRPGRAETRERVAAMLSAVGLEPVHGRRHPHQFSGGQRQRIAIARALITSPKLVVADEAVSALDLSVQAQVLNLLLDLRDRSGVAFLFITHNLAVVDAIADRVGVMYRGRLVEQGPAHAVFDHPFHPYTSRLAEAEPSITRFGRPPTTAISPPVASSGPITGGCAYRDRCPLAVARCAAEAPDLRPVIGARLAACHRAEEIAAGPPRR